MPAAHENEKPKAKDKSTTVTSPVGETEPTQVFGGDGVTPIAEWEEKYAELKKKQAEKDTERREKAAKEEESGNVMTTAKGK